MIHWLQTAISTYLLHPMHGNGYQWWSGLGSGSAWIGGLVVFAHRHNCHRKGCWRLVRHGATHCYRHAQETSR